MENETEASGAKNRPSATMGKAMGEAEQRRAVIAPTVGDTVLVDTGAREFNGSRICPAIVTNVFGNGSNGVVPCINCRVLVDGDEVLWLTSLVHLSQVGKPTRYGQPRPSYYFFRFEKPVE